MYTGIVDHIAKIVDLERSGETSILTIASHFDGFMLGESIAIDGICVTVTHFEGGTFQCDISPETQRLTTAKFFKQNQYVNVERSLRPQDRMGGHYVMGHIDQTCQLMSRVPHSDFVEMTFSGVLEKGRRYFIPKGSVAVNGTSLTLNRCEQDTFTVMLIPHTLERTNLGELKEGDSVNVEYDWMVKTVVEQLKFSEVIA